MPSELDNKSESEFLFVFQSYMHCNTAAFLQLLVQTFCLTACNWHYRLVNFKRKGSL